MEINLLEFLEKCHDAHASDLHFTTGSQPIMRIHGRLIRMGDYSLTPEDILRFIVQILDDQQIEKLEEAGEIDSSYSVSGRFRFRVNVFKQRGTYAVSMRYVNSSILSLQELGLPPAINAFTKKNYGIVLVTGPTGSGKSTTLATMIDIINQERDCHILTLEDPIEFLHKHKKGIVNQREIGSDSRTYHNALRAALREDPDVILIGEMRDYESIAIALTAAETGHLVFSSLHTLGAAKTIDRIIDVFPPGQQQQIRIQLSMALQGVISQQLITNLDQRRRELAVEVMVATPAIRNMIREAKTPQINNAILTGSSNGMVSMDNSLLQLYKSRKISIEDVLSHCMEPDYIKQNASF